MMTSSVMYHKPVIMESHISRPHPRKMSEKLDDKTLAESFFDLFKPPNEESTMPTPIGKEIDRFH